ncbi:MAG TPA: hypothetical protein VI653_05625 [Steroidobacteraceae bacterium]
MTHRSILATAVFATLAWLFVAAAQAGTQTFELVRGTLQNIPDAAGSYQYEGGTLENALGKAIGTYLIVRRTGSGAERFNTGATTITLFFPPAPSINAPPVVTIQGSWSFSSGNFKGSVSAASLEFHWIVGADAASTTLAGTTSKLVLSWIGSNQLQL